MVIAVVIAGQSNGLSLDFLDLLVVIHGNMNSDTGGINDIFVAGPFATAKYLWELSRKKLSQDLMW